MNTVSAIFRGLVLLVLIVLATACSNEPAVVITGADADAPPEQDIMDTVDIAEAEAEPEAEPDTDIDSDDNNELPLSEQEQDSDADDLQDTDTDDLLDGDDDDSAEPEEEWEELTPVGGCCGEGLPPCESGHCSKIGEAQLCTNEYCSGPHTIWCRWSECYDQNGQVNNLYGRCADYSDIMACIPPGPKTPMCGCCGDDLPPCEFGTRCVSIDGHSMCTRSCDEPGSHIWGSAQVGDCLEDRHVDDCLGAWQQCPAAIDGDDDSAEPEEEWEELTPVGGCCGEGLPPCESGYCSKIGEAQLCTNEYCSGLHTKWCRWGECYDQNGQVNNLYGRCADYSDIMACIPPGPITPMCGCCGDDLPPCEFGTRCVSIDGHSMCTRLCDEPGSHIWGSAQVGECLEDRHVDDCLGAWQQCPAAADGDDDSAEEPEEKRESLDPVLSPG